MRGEEPALSLGIMQSPFAGATTGVSRSATPWPGLLTWMGWNSVLSWLQRAARGQVKRDSLTQEPDGLGISAAGEVPQCVKEARAGSSSSCESCLLPRKTKQRALEADLQASPQRPSQHCFLHHPTNGRGVIREGEVPGAQLSPATE